MRFIGAVLAFAVFFCICNFNIWSSAGMAIWIGYLISMIGNVNKGIAFREYILVMYGLNYLFSPGITFEVTQAIAIYKMKGTQQAYFSLAIPAMFCLHAGLYSLKTSVFSPTFALTKLQRFLNESLLKQWLIAGVILYFVQRYLPGDIAFLIYLLSGIRFVAAFGLFILDKAKYKWYLVGLLLVEVTQALTEGMFHDLIVWVLFFGLLWAYLYKPSTIVKISLGLLAFFCFFVLQSTKETYREGIHSGQGSGISSFSNAVSKKKQGQQGLFNFQNFSEAINRANQAWIFASSMEQMNVQQNYQGLTIVKKYAEAAILPRFLAPNKLEAGDKGIFNQFSGAYIPAYSSTSMGLGIMADGYISYGKWGTLLFAYIFGLLCCLTFKIIENWSEISPLFILFFYPLLNYAVRADCETQTMMGHIVKGLIAFGILLFFTKQYLQKKTIFYENEAFLQQQEEEAGQDYLVPKTA